MSLETFLFGLTLLAYFVSSVLYHGHLFAGSDRARRLATLSAAGGVLAHTAAIGYWCVNHPGSILRDPGMPFSVVAYFIAIVQTVVGLRSGWASLGSLTMPLAFVAQFYSSAQTPGSAVQAPPVSPLLSPHVMAILLGFAAFTLAFCLAVTYLLESRLLKTKQVRGLFRRLPPLESVGTAAHWLAVAGFSMLTLGIVTGAIVAPRAWGPGWYYDTRVLTSIVAWAIYAAYLGAIMLAGWRGRRTTYFLIVGYVVVLVAFFASVARPKSVSPPGATAGLSAPAAEADLLARRAQAGPSVSCPDAHRLRPA